MQASRTPFSLKDVPIKFRSKEMCIKYIQDNPGLIKYVPAEYLTHEICVRCIKSDGHLINYVPTKFLTPKFYGDIFAHNFEHIQHIPKELITWNMCEKISLSSGSVRYIPEKYIEKYLDRFTSSIFKPCNLRYFYGMEISGKLFKKYFKQIPIRQLTQYDHNDNVHWKFTDFLTGDDIIENDNLIAFDLDVMSRLYECDTNKCFISDIIPSDDAKITFCKDGVKVSSFRRGPKTEYI
jgi:hypothetical protein